MTRVAAARAGDELRLKQRPFAFSFWPTRRSTRRAGLQSRVFVTDPWALIRNSVSTKCPPTSRKQAHGFREQAQDYFRAAQGSGLFRAKPVLVYYSILNLAKTYVLTVGAHPTYDVAMHGLSHKASGTRELLDSYLKAMPTTATQTNVFDDLLGAIRGNSLPSNTDFQIPHLLPQLLQGHRLWCAAAKKEERFVEVAEISVLEDKPAKEIWLLLGVFEDDLARLGVTRKRFLRDSQLGQDFKSVKGRAVGGRTLLLFEQKSPIAYTGRAADKVGGLVQTVKNTLWANVLSIPPYRKYYAYLAPPAEHPSVLPQLLAIQAFFFYLGSRTRYRPERVDVLMAGPFGAQLEEAVTNLPNQFLYLMASEFAEQEVARAAVV